MKKIRILHVLGGMNQGGVENFLMNIYRGIDKEKIQFDFLVNREGNFDNEIKKLGGNIYYIPALQSVGEYKYRKELNSFFKAHQGKYKIIHSHLNQVSGLILEIANKNGIPIRIAHSHNNAYSINYFAILYKEVLRKKIDKYANVLLACSDLAANFMFHKNSKKAIIINNGIPTEKFIFSKLKRQEFRKKYNFNDDDLVIGHIGRFEKQKNHKFLIDIFIEILKEKKNSYLILLGQGSTKRIIQEKCIKENISDKVIFLDSTPDTDKIYCGVDCFVFPSLYEGLGMVLVEAQISGLYCYASSKVIPQTAKITEDFSFVSLDEKAKSWAKKILKNSDNYKCREHKKVKNNPYDINEVIEKLTNLYLDSYKGI